MTELEHAKAKLATKLEGLDAPAPPRLHPSAAMIYRAKVADLQGCLSGSDIHSTEAAAILRQLIDKVVLTPDADAPDGLQAELHGDLVDGIQHLVPMQPEVESQ